MSSRPIRAASVSSECSWLIFDGNIRTGGALVLLAKKVGDLLILGLFHGGFVALVTRTHETLLNKVDT